MPKILDEIYQNFYEPQEYPNLQASIEQNKQLLLDKPAEPQKNLLRILDAKDMISNLQTKDGFIQGFLLGLNLSTEKEKYSEYAEIEKGEFDTDEFLQANK